MLPEKERQRALEEEVTRIAIDAHLVLANDHHYLDDPRLPFKTKIEVVKKHVLVVEGAIAAINDIRVIYDLGSPYVVETLKSMRELLHDLQELAELETIWGSVRVLFRPLLKLGPWFLGLFRRRHSKYVK